MTWKRMLGLVGFVLLPLGVGLVGSLVTTPAIPTWYASLTLPGFAPPPVVFGPVWTLLYLLMGVASAMVWVASSSQWRSLGLKVYAGQLGLNLLWSMLFFGLRSPLLGLVNILALLAMILVTASYFWRVNRLAGILLVPYILWVSFASMLNFAIWRLN